MSVNAENFELSQEILEKDARIKALRTFAAQKILLQLDTAAKKENSKLRLENKQLKEENELLKKENAALKSA